MRGLLQRAERHEAHSVGLARFLERPADARVARKAWPPSGERSKAVMTTVIATAPLHREAGRLQQDIGSSDPGADARCHG